MASEQYSPADVQPPSSCVHSPIEQQPMRVQKRANFTRTSTQISVEFLLKFGETNKQQTPHLEQTWPLHRLGTKRNQFSTQKERYGGVLLLPVIPLSPINLSVRSILLPFPHATR
jgi:hypothetical protein